MAFSHIQPCWSGGNELSPAPEAKLHLKSPVINVFPCGSSSSEVRSGIHEGFYMVGLKAPLIVILSSNPNQILTVQLSGILWHTDCLKDG